jgi:deoxyuridine 5'-triphosphate nucleotidohydrolase
MELKIYKMYEDAPDPLYGSNHAACFDISAYLPYQSAVKGYSKSNDTIEMLTVQNVDGKNFIDIPPEWRILIPTGLIFDIPVSCSVRLYARSGLSTKQGLNLINSVGIIDCDYVEQVFVPVYNNSLKKIRIHNGDRISQAELVFNNRAILQYIQDRPNSKSNRNGGFGSTGT